MTPGEGEQREAAGRRRFWKILGGLMLGGFVVGLVGGIVYFMAENDFLSVDAIPQFATIAAVAIAVAAFLYGSWRFFLVVDEVEMQDNLWGSMIAFYVYSTLFPAWWVLSWAGVTTEPHDWAIFAISLASGCLVYGWRKWRTR